MAYHVLKNDQFGDLDFFGNGGALSMFEDETNQAIGDIFVDGKAVKLSNIYELLYWCHYVACKRLKKDINVTREDLRLFVSMKEAMPIFQKLLTDIVKDIGLDATPEKKMKVEK